MNSDFIEMSKSLVCILDKESVISILLGDGYSIDLIEEFINECEK